MARKRIMFQFLRSVVLIVSLFWSCFALDLRDATVVTPSILSGSEQKALSLLLDEVESRTLIRWPVASQPGPGTPCISISRATNRELPAEGFSIEVGPVSGTACAVRVVGNDSRGVLFGVGRLLRELEMGRNSVHLRDSWSVQTAPKLRVRGHQLGFRSANNTYDLWTVQDYEKYIRDLAVFGANTIEVTGDGSDADNGLFPMTPLRMHQQLSRLAQEYGLDFSIWLPASQKSYDDPATVEKELRHWDAVFAALPKIDAIFVPGGDPGHTEPRILMPFLAKAAAVLKKHHPNAGMWVSPQGMDDVWLAQFYAELRKNPSWLAGVVHGPWVRPSMKDFRMAVPSSIPIRLYPDITHTLRCQFPLVDWDPAFAITHGRESINPMPLWETEIFRGYYPGSIGFVSYSDGAHDDFNKILWTALAWDPDANPVDITRDYARYFTGVPAVADGILALERNWRGPLASNPNISQTETQFAEMEQAASPQLKRNWRFQQLLYRAYYDAYVQRRLFYETGLEADARHLLEQAPRMGALAAMDAAERTLLKTVTEPAALDSRSRVFELGEALFQSLGAQLSVKRHGAAGWERGATLDTVDRPLNNRKWMLSRFAAARRLDREEERLAALHEILHWQDPGPGGFYDDLGNPSRQPHLLLDGQPGQQGFWEVLEGPLSWLSHANSWRNRPIQMEYTGLDPSAEYKVRVVYGGENAVPDQGIRLIANQTIVIHPYMRKPLPIRPLEFDIPREATRSGRLLLAWDREEPPSGRLRGAQVSEVWLIRK
ncbi:MAG: hypothetical protein LC114_01620 [Bryobacterales bacterium]|nr:hypothetical protein [Bryobacterales bacterium]